MDIAFLFFGKAGAVYSSSSIILIVGLMLAVTLQLFRRRRKKAYLSLTLSLAIIIVQYMLLIVYQLRSDAAPETGQYAARFLHVIAFILINMGIYQLYNASRSREYSIMSGFLFVACVIAGVRWWFVSGAPGADRTYTAFHNIWIDLYLLVLIVLAHSLIAPNIGQRRKYAAALAVFFVAQLSGVVGRHFLDEPNRALMLAENFLPILFYAILFLIIFNRVVELLQAIYNSSIRDGLTGLFNRPYFQNRVVEAIGRGAGASVIFCDIDNFKRLNDTMGHHAGDRVLRHVAAILQEECEGIGIAGRFGGEELVVLIPDKSLRVEKVAERIRQRVEAETGATVSVGFCKHRKGMSPEELIRCADQAMYQAKKTGKNKVAGYASPV